MRKIFYHKYFLALLVTIIAFTVYFLTICPTIYLEDSAEFVTAAYTLGIPHSPSFPLYVILANIFIKIIPIGEIAWRVNLMSAFFGALTIGLLSLIINKLTRYKILAFAIPLVYAFTRIFWSQSLIAEVYTLNAFFLALIILLLLKWKGNKREKFLLFIAFTYGLAMTNHIFLMALLAPFGIIFFLVEDRKMFKNRKLLTKMFLLFLIGFSVYLYLPIRSMSDVFMDAGNPETLRNFWDVITYKKYSDVGLGINISGQKLYFIVAFFQNLVREFSFLLIPFGLIGIFYLYLKKREKYLTLFLVLILLFINSIFRTIISNVSWNESNEYMFRVFDIPAHLAFVILIALGIGYVSKLLLARSKIYYLAFCLLIIFTPVYFLLTNYQNNNLSDFDLNYQYGNTLLNSLDQNAVLLNLSVLDSEAFSTLYFDQVEKLRPDLSHMNGLYYPTIPEFESKVVVYRASEKSEIELADNEQPVDPDKPVFEKDIEGWRKILFFAIRELLNEEGQLSRPLYISVTLDELGRDDIFSNLHFRSNGLVYRVFLSEEEAAQADDWQPLELEVKEDWNLDILFGQGMVSRNQYALASYYFEQDNPDKGREYLIRAINNDIDVYSVRYITMVRHIQNIEKQKGVIFLDFKE